MIKRWRKLFLGSISGLLLSALIILPICFAQDITIGATNKLPNTVSMPKATVQDNIVRENTVSVLEYIRGVCRAEIGIIGLSQSGEELTDAQKIELYKAQAIAAATYLARRTGGKQTVLVIHRRSPA